MKHKKFIKLFSGLLCASMLLTGCNGSGANTDNIETGTPIKMVASENNSGKLSDYINITYESGYNLISTEETVLNEEYGSLVSESYGLYIFKKVDKDFMNNVTETYSVYNADEGKVVLTLNNTYEDGNYGDYDEFDNVKRVPSQMTVTVKETNQVNYIEVITRKYTRLDDEVIEENELEESYSKTYQAEYYDLKGKLITKTLKPITVKYLGSSDGMFYNKVKLAFGKNVAVFDERENEMIDTWNEETETKLSLFNYQNDKYNYCLNERGIKVYDKKDNLVFTYGASMNEYISSFVLDNGNILVQKMSQGSGDSYDVIISGNKVNYNVFLIDVASKKITEVETDYVFQMVYNASDVEDEEIGFTDKVINVGSVSKIVNRTISTDDMQMVFFDNALNVQYVYEDFIPEQEFFGSMERLKTGDYLVEIDSPVAEKAIVKEDGTLRTYLPYGAMIFEDTIIIGNTVYDFDLNKINEINIGSGQGSEWSYVGNIGNKLVFTRQESNYNSEKVTSIRIVEKSGSYFNTDYYSFTGEIIDLTDSYIIIKQDYNDKYVMYNISFNQIIRSDSYINVDEYDDRYVLSTYVNGENHIFVVEVGNEGGAV